jgi:hypothetical protein
MGNLSNAQPVTARAAQQPLLLPQIVVRGRVPAKSHAKEASAAEAKATALSRTFGRDTVVSMESSAVTFEERAAAKVMGTIATLPGLSRAPAVLQKIGKYGGPGFTTLAFGFTAVETAKHWHQSSNSERAFGVVSTVAAGAAAATATAASVGAAGAASLVGPVAGVAGTIFAAGAAWHSFHDPKQTAGQRGLSLVAVGLQAGGTVLCATPLAPLGIGLMLVGAHFSILGGWVGKNRAVDSFFRKVGIHSGNTAPALH